MSGKQENETEAVEARTVNTTSFTSAPVVSGDGDGFALMVGNEVKVQVATAKQYPRDIKKSTKQAIESIVGCEGLPEQCIYSLPRGGKNIQGPSIRLAEVMLHHWGNTRIMCRTVAEHDDHVEVEAWAMDLEQNVGVSIPIRRRIIDSSGKRYNSDMINTTTMAALKIAFRNAVLALVPPFVTQEVYRAVRRHAVGDLADLPKRWAKACKKWLTLGVTEEMLLRHLEIEKSGQLSIADFEYMIGLFNAINEGDFQKEKVFATTKSERTGTKAGASLDDLADKMEAEGDSEKPEESAPSKPRGKRKAKAKPNPRSSSTTHTTSEAISKAAEHATKETDAKASEDQPLDGDMGPDDYWADDRVEPMMESKEMNSEGCNAIIREAVANQWTVDELLEKIDELPEPEEKDPITRDDVHGSEPEQTELGEDESLY